MNITSVKQGSTYGEHRIEGDGFLAIAYLPTAKTPKKTRVYLPDTIEKRVVEGMATLGQTRPEYPARPSQECWTAEDEASVAFREAAGAWEKAYVAFQRTVRRFAKPLVLEAAKALGFAVETLAWNAKAGCSCGCSPAFVAQAALPITVTVPSLFPHGEPVERTLYVESLFLR